MPLILSFCHRSVLNKKKKKMFSLKYFIAVRVCIGYRAGITNLVSGWFTDCFENLRQTGWQFVPQFLLSEDWTGAYFWRVFRGVIIWNLQMKETKVTKVFLCLKQKCNARGSSKMNILCDFIFFCLRTNFVSTFFRLSFKYVMKSVELHARSQEYFRAFAVLGLCL